MPEAFAFCGKCGAALAASDVPAVASGGEVVEAPPAVASAPPVRPWVRYWARMFDVFLFSVTAGVLVGVLAYEDLLEGVPDRVFALAVLFLWVFVEAALLSTFGTTPGKWLLRTHLRLQSGRPMTYGEALTRSLHVWWRGLGVGFPLASLITLSLAKGRLTRDGITSWDRDGGFVVTHEPIGAGRILALIVFFLLCFALAVLGTVPDGGMQPTA